MCFDGWKLNVNAITIIRWKTLVNVIISRQSALSMGLLGHRYYYFYGSSQSANALNCHVPRKGVRQEAHVVCGMHPGVTVVTMLIELAFKRVRTGDTIMEIRMLYLDIISLFHHFRWEPRCQYAFRGRCEAPTTNLQWRPDIFECECSLMYFLLRSS